MSNFKKATKEKAKLRLVMHGPSGSGKTYSALSIATNLGGRVALIDTEAGSARKYGDVFDFDAQEIIKDYHPNRLIKAMEEAAAEGYGVVVVDSCTHFWNGTNGFLELVDQEAKRGQAKNGKYDSHAAWKAVDVLYRLLLSAILTSPMHVVFTLRAKQEIVRNDQTKKLEKLGMAPQMRDSFEYEFDVEGSLTMEHQLFVGKTRCSAIDQKMYSNPGKDIAADLLAWLNNGVDRKVAPPPSSGDLETQLRASVDPQEALGNLLAAVDACESVGSLNELWAQSKGLPQHMREQLRAACGQRKAELVADGADNTAAQ
jgi:hypothetical protein